VTAAAFFDLDRTVMSGASPFYFGKAALKRGFYSRRAMMRDAGKVFLFKVRGASDEDSAATRDWILANVAGRRSDEMLPLTPDVLGPILRRIYPDIYDRILAHERAGVATYLCSASPIEIVARVATALDMSGGALATTAEIGPDGVYTGLLSGPFCYGEGKAAAIRIEAEAKGLDLRESWAYSDSVSDLPMMEAVGKPVAVNPDKELARIASERGWETVRVEPRHIVRLAVGGALVLMASGAITTWLVVRRAQRRARVAVPASTTPEARSVRSRLGLYAVRSVMNWAYLRWATRLRERA
jgi:HAD superfamily hydrolase (TIGR01490 family)